MASRISSAVSRRVRRKPLDVRSGAVDIIVATVAFRRAEPPGLRLRDRITTCTGTRCASCNWPRRPPGFDEQTHSDGDLLAGRRPGVYIKLESRVKARMALGDASASGEEKSLLTPSEDAGDLGIARIRLHCPAQRDPRPRRHAKECRSLIFVGRLPDRAGALHEREPEACWKAQRRACAVACQSG